MLKKRWDLVPNLVASVQAYMQHESRTFAQIAELRSRAMGGGLSADQRMRVEDQLGGALRAVMLQVESYPALQSSHNVMHLQRTLTELEEQLSAARRAYNASVLELNNAVGMFPTNIFAGMVGVGPQPMLEAPQEERACPDVKGMF
jgi:LemA protein